MQRRYEPAVDDSIIYNDADIGYIKLHTIAEIYS